MFTEALCSVHGRLQGTVELSGEARSAHTEIDKHDLAAGRNAISHPLLEELAPWFPVLDQCVFCMLAVLSSGDSSKLRQHLPSDTAHAGSLTAHSKLKSLIG